MSKKKKEFSGKYENHFLYITNGWQFRFNVVISQYEFRVLVKGKPTPKFQWKEFSDREKNDILLELIEQDLDIPESKFNIFVESSTISPDYNPFDEYFNSLSSWDGKVDYIGQLAQTIQVAGGKAKATHFKKVFTKFLVGCVNCLLEEDEVNDVCLVFQSGQGVGKTRWMRRILPEQFRTQYFYEGNIDTKNKDHTIYLSQYFLIHLDELETLRSNDIGAIKSYITRQRISERKAFGRYKSRYIRRASFLGSVNDDKFLSDITGNRRWLVFTILKADYQHRVNVDGVWSQAFSLWQDGMQHWFDVDEIAEINQQNEQYRTMTIEEEYCLQFLSFPEQESIETMFMSASDVLQKFHELRPAMTSKMTTRNIGKALSIYANDKKMSSGITKYLVCVDYSTTEQTKTQSNEPVTEIIPPNSDENDDIPF